MSTGCVQVSSRSTKPQRVEDQRSVGARAIKASGESGHVKPSIKVQKRYQQRRIMVDRSETIHNRTYLYDHVIIFFLYS